MGFKYWKAVKRVTVYWIPGSIPLGWRGPIKHGNFEQVGALLDRHNPYYREVDESLKDQDTWHMEAARFQKEI